MPSLGVTLKRPARGHNKASTARIWTPIVIKPKRVESSFESVPRPSASVAVNASTVHGAHKAASVSAFAWIGSRPLASAVTSSPRSVSR